MFAPRPGKPLPLSSETRLCKYKSNKPQTSLELHNHKHIDTGRVLFSHFASEKVSKCDNIISDDRISYRGIAIDDVIHCLRCVVKRQRTYSLLQSPTNSFHQSSQ